ncbi:MAG: hypothetical protein Q9O24_01465 [Gammaproteobacteria bacterium]|nr:hypothetical protein [Gammaproteobacteria bacterium]
MAATPHIVVTLTAHGYGHVAQTAPILNALQQHLPNLRITLFSDIETDYLKRRIHAPFQQHKIALDVGLLMDDQIKPRLAESHHAYQYFHRQWQNKVNQLSDHFKTLKPDLLLSNVAYLPIVAAKQLNIPSIALCSLNWADIYQHCCAHFSNADQIHQQIVQAYQQSTHFLKPKPSMPMDCITHSQYISPITNLGKHRRIEINQHLNISPQKKLIVVGLGGINSRFYLQPWPKNPDYHWLVPENWLNPQANMSSVESCPFSFIDLLASADLLISKPGYGSFSEAACNARSLPLFRA